MNMYLIKWYIWNSEKCRSVLNLNIYKIKYFICFFIKCEFEVNMYYYFRVLGSWCGGYMVVEVLDMMWRFYVLVEFVYNRFVVFY